MSCTDEKCKVDPTTEIEEEHHKCKNSRGEHLNNVDIELVQMASGKVRVWVHAIIDHQEHGNPYEETSRTLLDVGSNALNVTLPTAETHWQSWWDIESNGWNDSADVLHHLPERFQSFIKTAAELGLSIVGSVDA